MGRARDCCIVTNSGARCRIQIKLWRMATERQHSRLKPVPIVKKGLNNVVEYGAAMTGLLPVVISITVNGNGLVSDG